MADIPEDAVSTEEGEAFSETERLILALQTCFHELIKKQEEQADRIHRAVEALKPPESVDTNTAFWGSYMKLADEHDKEFQKKYSNDLDTALIFAGLFSAVSSAFIIQIQPEITTAVQPELTSPPPAIVVLAQSLLYISLFTTLFAALLAVLGKQWITYYDAAGSRGSIEERGLERQRKLDGLRQWKFDVVCRVFPSFCSSPFSYSQRRYPFIVDSPSHTCHYCHVVDIVRIHYLYPSACICPSFYRLPVSNSPCFPSPLVRVQNQSHLALRRKIPPLSGNF
ncbi:hypothetical protein K438DRAFT_516343 [Mycena galopus ATCC 62051]|nr:hypothetical protein K438DRAFT_516343 [Mycena galopus ATCC 62051]